MFATTSVHFMAIASLLLAGAHAGCSEEDPDSFSIVVDGQLLPTPEDSSRATRVTETGKLSLSVWGTDPGDPVAVDDEFGIGVHLTFDAALLEALPLNTAIRFTGTTRFSTAQDDPPTTQGTAVWEATTGPQGLLTDASITTTCFGCLTPSSGEQELDITVRITGLTKGRIAGSMTIDMSGLIPSLQIDGAVKDDVTAEITATFDTAIRTQTGGLIKE